MFLVPYRRIRITSARPAAELSLRVQNVTSASQPWFRSLVGKFEFVGNVTPDKFRIIPVLRGGNTYRPLVLGSVHDRESGSEILLTQTLHPVAVAAVLLSFGWIAAISAIHDGLRGASFVAAATLVFHVVMFYVGFVPEAQRVEARISELAG